MRITTGKSKSLARRRTVRPDGSIYRTLRRTQKKGGRYIELAIELALLILILWGLWAVIKWAFFK